MKFSLLFYESAHDFAAREHPERSGPYWSGWQAYIGALDEAGVLVSGGAALLPPETATTVRFSGERTVQDGPFADTKEQLAGFVFIEVPDREAALAWAARCPTEQGAVEVRPVLPPMG